MVNLLEILYFSDQWLTVGNIAEDLDVSEKTVNRDFKLINAKWPHLVQLETSFVYGVRVNFISTSNLLTMFSDIFRADNAIKWLKLLFYEPYNPLTFYATKLHVSESTLNRLFIKINASLAKYALKIERHISLYFISAENEFLGRLIFSFLFLEVSGYDMYNIMSLDCFSVIEERLKKSLLLDTLQESELQYYLVIALNYVSLVRENQGFTLSQELFNHKGSVPDEYLSFLKSKFPNLTPAAILAVEESLRLHKGEQAADKQPLIKIEQATHRLFADLQLSAKEKERVIFQRLLVDIYLNQIQFGLPFWVLFNRFNYFAIQLKKDNLALFNKIEWHITALSKDIACDFLPVFDFILYGLATIAPQILGYIREQNILVVSDFSLQHAEFLSTVISQSLSLNYEAGLKISKTTYQHLDEQDLTQYRFIITNRSIENLPIDTILIDDFPTESMIMAISKKINSPFKKADKKNSDH